MSFLMMGIFIIGFVNIDRWIRNWGGTDINISIYLKDNIKSKDRLFIKKRIENLKGIKDIRYVSKVKAKEDLKKILGLQSEFVDLLRENPLPASYEVILDRSNEPLIHEIVQKIEILPGVEEVQYTAQYKEKLEGLLYILKLSGIVIWVFLCAASLIIIYNTIKLTIYNRKEEIEILSLVGATEWFIKAPFIIEGFIQGLIGGILSIGILYILFLLFSFKRIYILGFSLPQPVFISLPWMVFLVLFSVIIGTSGGILAVSRFYEEK